jgi:hypothetical protein
MVGSFLEGFRTKKKQIMDDNGIIYKIQSVTIQLKISLRNQLVLVQCIVGRSLKKHQVLNLKC